MFVVVVIQSWRIMACSNSSAHHTGTLECFQALPLHEAQRDVVAFVAAGDRPPASLGEPRWLMFNECKTHEGLLDLATRVAIVSRVASYQGESAAGYRSRSSSSVLSILQGRSS